MFNQILNLTPELTTGGCVTAKFNYVMHSWKYVIDFKFKTIEKEGRQDDTKIKIFIKCCIIIQKDTHLKIPYQIYNPSLKRYVHLFQDCGFILPKEEINEVFFLFFD